MSVREQFLKHFAREYKSLEDGALDTVEFLLDSIEELENVKNEQRERIKELEKDKNLLLSLLDEAKGAGDFSLELEDILEEAEADFEDEEEKEKFFEKLTDALRDAAQFAGKIADAAEECDSSLPKRKVKYQYGGKESSASVFKAEEDETDMEAILRAALGMSDSEEDSEEVYSPEEEEISEEDEFIASELRRFLGSEVESIPIIKETSEDGIVKTGKILKDLDFDSETGVEFDEMSRKCEEAAEKIRQRNEEIERRKLEEMYAEPEEDDSDGEEDLENKDFVYVPPTVKKIDPEDIYGIKPERKVTEEVKKTEEKTVALPAEKIGAHRVEEKTPETNGGQKSKVLIMKEQLARIRKQLKNVDTEN